MDINFFCGVFQSSSKMKKKIGLIFVFVSPVAGKVKKKIYMYNFLVFFQ